MDCKLCKGNINTFGQLSHEIEINHYYKVSKWDKLQQ
jgi:hypothetical protein